MVSKGKGYYQEEETVLITLNWRKLMFKCLIDLNGKNVTESVDQKTEIARKWEKRKTLISGASTLNGKFMVSVDAKTKNVIFTNFAAAENFKYTT